MAQYHLLSYSFDYMTKKIHSFLIDEYYFSEKLIINIIIIYVTRKKNRIKRNCECGMI